MNPKRLAELQRQRELVREHLAWLEREIAREHNITPGPVSPAVVSVAIERTPDETMPKPNPADAAASARRGCFIVFFLALALLAAALAALFWFRYRDRPLLFVPKDSPPTKSSEALPPALHAPFFAKLSMPLPV